jgi:hypothetical protein
LRRSIYFAIEFALNNVALANGALKYQEDWDCDYNVEAFLQQREADERARAAEEKARILRSES